MHLETSSMKSHDLAGQTQPNARTSLFGSKKRHENILNQTWFNARTVVSDLDIIVFMTIIKPLFGYISKYYNYE